MPIIINIKDVTNFNKKGIYHEIHTIFCTHELMQYICFCTVDKPGGGHQKRSATDSKSDRKLKGIPQEYDKRSANAYQRAR